VSTKSEQLRELARQIHAAEAANPGVEQLQFEAAERLREFADRLDAVAVSHAMVGSVGKALYIYWDDVTKNAQGKYREKVRAALESILPIADEKDACRYKWLRSRMTVTDAQQYADIGGRQCEEYEIEIDRQIDRSIASAKGDAR